MDTFTLVHREVFRTRVKNAIESRRIKATQTDISVLSVSSSSQTELLLRREKGGCSGVHPADMSKGKQDTAGQRWTPQQWRTTASKSSIEERTAYIQPAAYKCEQHTKTSPLMKICSQRLRIYNLLIIIFNIYTNQSVLSTCLVQKSYGPTYRVFPADTNTDHWWYWLIYSQYWSYLTCFADGVRYMSHTLCKSCLGRPVAWWWCEEAGGRSYRLQTPQVIGDKKHQLWSNYYVFLIALQIFYHQCLSHDESEVETVF